MALVVVLLAPALPSGSPPEEHTLAFDAPRVRIGRAASADLVLPDPSVSLQHASLRQKGADWTLVDEGSASGTFVASASGGRLRLGPQAPHPLRSGDRVRLGRIWLEVRTDPLRAADATPARAREVALRLVSRGLEAAGEPAGPCVVVGDGPQAGEVVPLPAAGPLAVGRGPDGGLSFGEAAKRRAAQLFVRGDRLLVRELGGEVEVGGQPLRGERALARGAEARVEGVSLRYDFPAADALDEIERAADEPLSLEEAPPPPSAPVAAPAAPSSEKVSPAVADEGERSFPRSEARPRAPLATTEADDDSGWSAGDAVVLLLGLGTLVAALLGWWALGR
jgi:hypothetical protein